MAKDKVTTQDIANALHLSRTTVSKVLNDAPNMPEKTVAAVLNKAKEMNYKQFAYLQAAQNIFENKIPPKKGGTFALLANFFPEHFHIASAIMASLKSEINEYGYSLTIYMINTEDTRSLQLPYSFDPESVDAILGIELFDEEYTKMLCSYGKPVLLFDSFHSPGRNPINANILLMESKNSMFRMLHRVILQENIKHIGFIGDHEHCISFHERFEGYRDALRFHDLPYEKQYCITKNDLLFQNPEFIKNELKNMPALPDLFCCANDMLAWRTIAALRSLNKKVPDDIFVCGFDDTPVLNSLESELTTVTTPSREMGITAAHILLDRIDNDSLAPVTVYLNSRVQIRSSTHKASR